MLETFFTEMLSNLQMVGIAFVVFAFAVLANIFGSCYYNTHTLKEDWSTSKFLDGILKMVVIGLTTGILAMVATALPYVLSMAGVTITDEMEQIYTVVAILGLYANGILKYYREAYSTTKEIIENRDIVEDVDEQIKVTFGDKEINNTTDAVG